VHFWVWLAKYACLNKRLVTQQPGLSTKTTTGGSVGSSAACMCGNGCMSMDGGFQAVHAAGENLQIRTLFYLKKNVFIG
jgi:hypothetical protein